jgi:peptidoglycan/xylan/chitin deacetylase (PgdA/CDA1 family)
LITFDDGFANNHSVVAPIMAERQLPWVLFTTTQALAGATEPPWFVALRAVALFEPGEDLELFGRRWPLADRAQRVRVFFDVVEHARSLGAREVVDAVASAYAGVRDHVPADFERGFCSFLSAEQVVELDRSGLVEVGGHTRTHPFLTSLTGEELRDELDGATAQLADVLGHPVRSFAYPFGCYGDRELERVAELGFECAFAVIPQVGRSPRYELPRIGISRPSGSTLRAKALGLAAMLRSFGMSVG